MKKIFERHITTAEKRMLYVVVGALLLDWSKNWIEECTKEQNAINVQCATLDGKSTTLNEPMNE